MPVKLLEDLYLAYYDARRHKRNTINQLKFELRLEDNLLRLYHQLEDRIYSPGRSVAFIIDKPVKREVFAASFADRVIHHLYFNYVNEMFERTFIEDCYSCRKGKGTQYGIERLDHHIRSCSQNYNKPCYILKLDLSGYFMSIDRNILYDKIIHTLRKYAKRKNLQGQHYREALDYDLLYYLTREIVFHDPVSDCYIKGKGDMSEWEGLPADKSLFTTAPGCGLPIGNLTSQLFSNIYLNSFDHYMKRTLRIKHYGRYVDDFFVVHPSKAYLMQLIEQIRVYLKDKLGIKLHPKKIYIQNIYRGVQFLGVVVRPHRKYILKRTVSNFKTSLAKGDIYHDKPMALLQTVNSYLGFMRHQKTFRLRREIIMKNSWIFRYGWIDVNFFRLRYDPYEYKNLPDCPDYEYLSNVK